MKDFLHNAFTVTKVAIARLRFIMVFIVAALVVGYWDNLKNYADKWTRPALAPDSLAAADASGIEFYCTMHPNVVRSEPGACPICGMPLTKRKKGEAQRLPADVLARVQLTPQRVALANVHTSPIEYRELLYEVQSVGVLDYDETKLARLSARVAGRADKLFVTYTGESVKKGDALYSLYSPEVYTALREYLLARQRLQALPADSPQDSRTDAATVSDASLQRLLLWGVTEKQLDQIAADFSKNGQVPSHIIIASPMTGTVVAKNLYEGGYVQVGDNVYTVADLSTLWLQAKLYERDVPIVKVGDAATVIVDAMPNESFPGKITFKAIQLDPQTRTLDARIEVSNPELKLHPGMFANADVKVPVAKTMPMTPAMTTQPAVTVAPAQVASAYAAALTPYLKAQKLLASDNAEGVVTLLQEVAAKLKTVASAPEVSAEYTRLSDAVTAMKDQPLKEIRNGYKVVSAAMFAIGKSVGVPAGGPQVQAYRCSMVSAPWLQEVGSKANPYMGSMMLTCGDDAGTLPAFTAEMLRPAHSTTAPAGRVLAVPRTAVIDTGRNKIVYVESAQGVYDMHAVKLGLPAGNYYPVFGGVEEGQSVVTVGAFLVDAENRLNPAKIAGPDMDEHHDHDHPAPSGSPMGGMKM
jgi:RND family efflux transporter MFP subunit